MGHPVSKPTVIEPPKGMCIPPDQYQVGVKIYMGKKNGREFDLGMVLHRDLIMVNRVDYIGFLATIGKTLNKKDEIIDV